MRLIGRDVLDITQWDLNVSNASVNNVMLYSWVLDVVSRDWGVITNNDNTFWLVVQIESDYGVKRIRQQMFTRQMNFLGDAAVLPQALDFIKSNFHFSDIRFSNYNSSNLEFVYQKANLKEYQLSKNAKRLIKKSDSIFNYETSNSTQDLMRFYRENTAVKLGYPESTISILSSLMDRALSENKAVIINALSEGVVCGSLCLLLDKSTVTYLIGDATVHDKKRGVMFGLMNFAMNYSTSLGFDVFDFGGSNVESVATFYKKMGGVDSAYSGFTHNNLPLWFKVLQKIKRS